jgi:hypothetical protein
MLAGPPPKFHGTRDILPDSPGRFNAGCSFEFGFVISLIALLALLLAGCGRERDDGSDIVKVTTRC